MIFAWPALLDDGAGVHDLSGAVTVTTVVVPAAATVVVAPGGVTVSDGVLDDLALGPQNSRIASAVTGSA